MDQSTPGPPVFYCLPELGQIHVDRFDDTVQPMTVVMVLNATVDCCSLYMVQMLFSYSLLNIVLHYLVQNVFSCFPPLKIRCILRSGASYGVKNTVNLFGDYSSTLWIAPVKGTLILMTAGSQHF